MNSKGAYLARKARRAARVRGRRHKVGEIVGKVELVNRVLVRGQVLRDGIQDLVVAVAVRVARAPLRVEFLVGLEEALGGIGVHRRFEDVDEHVERERYAREDEEVGGGGGAVEALLFHCACAKRTRG